jgi:hypothetical protein
MTLHFARSGGGKGSRKECEDEVKFSVVLIAILDQPVLRRGKTEIHCLRTDQTGFFCFHPEKGEEKERDKEHTKPVEQEFPTHDDLLSTLIKIKTNSMIQSGKLNTS